MHIFTSKGKRDPCADFMSDIIYLNRANSRMIATDKIHSYTKRLMYFFPHIISSIIIPRFEYSPTQWLRPNNDSASTEMKKRIRLLQYTRPNTDTVPCWWSLVMFHADKQWGARELRGPVCPTATHVSPPGSPLNFWYFTRHPAPACARTFPFFAFPSSHLCGGGRGCRRIRHVTDQCHEDRLHLIENDRKEFRSTAFVSSADGRIGT